jgi:hypothetical protein
MTTFTVKKKLDLAFLGQGWDTGAFLNFRSMTFAETREFAKLSAPATPPAVPSNVGFDGKAIVAPASDVPAGTLDNLEQVLTIVKDHFIDGRGYDGNALSDITVDDIEDLPTEVITKSVALLAGSPDPKS